MIFEGALSVKAIIQANRRTVDEVWIDEEKVSKDCNYIMAIAKEKKITVYRKKRCDIDAVCVGKTHGGVIAIAGERRYQDVQSMLKKKAPFIVLLEGIEDPFNLGYAIRTLYSAGCDGLIIADRDWSYSDSTIVKSSAGASEWLNICSSSDLASDLMKCKKAGCSIIGAHRKDAISFFDVDFKVPLVLCVGGEMRGLSKKVQEVIDFHCYIPYANDFRNALNASSAISVISYEVFRQRTMNV